MTDLLVELLCEEIPARFQSKAEENFLENIKTGLAENGFEFKEAVSYSTPRRLAIVIKGLPDKQPDISEERKGPKADAPEQAVAGFLKSVGLTSLDECELRDTDKGKVYYVVIDKKGQNTVDVLPNIINKSINDIHWANSMRFAKSDFRFVRPLRRIIATFGNDTINGTFNVDTTEIPYTNATTGHRFLSNNDIVVNADTYETELNKVDIIVSRETRKNIIVEQLSKLATEKSISLIEDDALLNEVTGLVEMPVTLIGNIEDRFMKLPKEVLITSMREHQKFFVFEDAKGNLAPYFATVANIKASDGGKAIVEGNERVLRARLADSEFFYNNDLKVKLTDQLPKLEKMTFHAKLGQVSDRVKRMTELSQSIAKQIGADEKQTKQASEICKADLVSEMVFEFPELQGLMGKYYATAQGYDETVATAIAEHYSPVGNSDDCPKNGVSVSVSIAEKLDTLTGFWLIDEKPTGSKDPYALRRSAIGIIRMILENELRIDLKSLIDISAKLHNVKGDITNDLLSFFADRVKSHLKSAGIRHDIIGAVLSNGITDLVAQVKLAEELSNNAEVVGQVKANYTRAKNITGKIDNLTFGNVDEALLQDNAEKELKTVLASAKTEIATAVNKEDFKSAVSVLAGIAPKLDAFFENVMVNADDDKVRTNRLNILGEIMDTANTIADFNIVE